LTLPSVSVVVVNWNGKHHLTACLKALLRQSYKGKLDLVLMDNGSTDGSEAFVQQAFPTVRVIQSPENLGFGGGNNYAAERLATDALAYVNNDTRADPTWLEEMVKVLVSAPDIAAVGGKILSWDRKQTDFIIGGATLTGYGLQIGWGDPMREDDKERDILSPCGGSMVIWRDRFNEVGRFDQDYFLFYEDLDLGWRLWLAGYRVRNAPKSLVEHVMHGSVRLVDDQRKAVLYDRNPLYTIYKNYDDAHLAQVLPAALLLLAEKVVLMVNPDRNAFALPVDEGNHSALPRRHMEIAQAPLARSLRERGVMGTAKRLPAATARRLSALNTKLRQQAMRRLGGDGSLPVRASAMSSLLAIEQFGQHLPVLRSKRAAVQAMRRRSDQEILKLFGLPLEPLAPVGGFAAYHRQMMQAFGLDAWVLPPQPSPERGGGL